MREIKFRVWCKNKNEWETDSMLIASNGELFQQMDRGYIKRVSLETHIVEQYTGLKDKNGTPIYEGDVIDIHQTVNGCNLFEIVWDKIGWSAKYAVDMVKPRLYEYNLEELFDVNYNEKYPYEITIEVIGNIHEGVKND